MIPKNTSPQEDEAIATLRIIGDCWGGGGALNLEGLWVDLAALRYLPGVAMLSDEQLDEELKSAGV